MHYIIYTEFHDGSDMSGERWFYGCYSDRGRANQVAYDMNLSSRPQGIYRVVCPIVDMYSLGVKNIPEYAKNHYENDTSK